MVALLVVLQVVVAIFLILVVLLQPGNKGGMSAAFGGAGGDTVFGARGANTFLSKLTYGAAAIFMITSVALSLKSAPRSLRKEPESAPASAPAQTQPAAPKPVVPEPAAPAAPKS